ncbi:MAG: glycosyltransferase family 4 protein [Pseudomonadota bacterium]|nr:glycosyltransferase family 4 protein [Pseudomonadota bacterium]
MSARGLLILTRNFPPLRGGMERLVHQLVLELSTRTTCTLIGPEGCEAAVPASIDATGLPLRPLGAFLLRVLMTGFRIARRRRPAVILCGSGLMAPAGWLIARSCGARVVCLLHGLDVVARHPLYRACFLPAIRRCDRLVVNSRHTDMLARAAGVDPQRISVLNPGVAGGASIAPHELASFRARHGLQDRPVILSVGRMTRRKGLLEFLDLAFPAVLQRHPHAVLLIVGGEATHALGKAHDRVQPALKQMIETRGWSDAVRLIGEVDERELALAYAAADVHAFPVVALPGDVEGFGMVAIEAAAAGVPTVAFAVGGVPDAVADGRSGRLVEPGDYAGFAQALSSLLARQQPELRSQACRAFADGFSWASRGDALYRIVTETVDHC